MIKMIEYLLWVFILLYTFNNADAGLMMPNNNIGESLIKTEGSINNKPFFLNVGFSGEVIGEQLNPLQLSFKENFNGNLIIYEIKRYNSNRSEQLFKKIKVNGKSLDTFIFLNHGNYKFYLEENNKSIYLGNKETSNHNGVFLSYKSITNKPSINTISNKIQLQPFHNLIITKEELSGSELEFIKNFVFEGKSVYLNDKLFLKYFTKLINKNSLELKKTKSIEYYKYGFGNIVINNNIDNDFEYNKINYSSQRENRVISHNINKIIIDDVIKSKMVPFYVILGFLFLYFIIILPLNFYLYKKSKSNFYLIYSTPIIALSFLVLLFSMSFFYKGITDIENKIQLNHIKDGKIYQEVFIYNFTPLGGNYKLSINSNDYKGDNYYFRYQKKNKINYKNGKIINTYDNTYPSSIIKYNYANVINNTGKENKYDRVYGTEEFEKKFNYTINGINKISSFGVTETMTDYMNKYTFGGGSNYNLQIDIFYK